MISPRLRGSLILTALALFAISVAAQNFSAPPWVKPGSIVNAASHLPARIPGGALAPGALAVLDGLHFDPADLHVELESDGTVTKAIILSAASDHVLVQLPSTNRTGPARLFVRSGRRRSIGSEIVLGAAAFGIFTANGKGWGPAASLDRATSTLQALPSVRRGATITLSGTGLGKVPAREIEVLVAGQRASHVSRTESNSLDHLSFTVPADAPLGCAVPVVVKAGGIFSNTVVVSIAGPSGCRGSEMWYEQEAARGERSATALLLRAEVVLELRRGNPVPFALDTFSADFVRHKGDSQVGPLGLLPPPGACISWAGNMNANELMLPSLIGPLPDSTDTGLDLGPEIAAQTAALEDLDAGPSLTITGPEGARPAVRSSHKPRVYTRILGGNPPLSRIPATPLFLNSGDYRIEIAGGADVGPGVALLHVPRQILWRNRESTPLLDRNAGALLEWTLAPNYIGAAVAWNIDRRNGVAGFTMCMAPPGATQFRLPPSSIANLPATPATPSDLSLGFLGVAALPLDPASFGTQGIDRGRLIAASLSGRTVIIR